MSKVIYRPKLNMKVRFSLKWKGSIKVQKKKKNSMGNNISSGYDS